VSETEEHTEPMPTSGMRRAYEEGLADLRLQVEVMGAKVYANLERMRAVLVDGDPDAGRRRWRPMTTSTTPTCR
jgi:hypothetical protein